MLSLEFRFHFRELCSFLGHAEEAGETDRKIDHLWSGSIETVTENARRNYYTDDLYAVLDNAREKCNEFCKMYVQMPPETLKGYVKSCREACLDADRRIAAISRTWLQ